MAMLTLNGRILTLWGFYTVKIFHVFPSASVPIEFGSRLTSYFLLHYLQGFEPKLLFARPDTAGKLAQ